MLGLISTGLLDGAGVGVFEGLGDLAIFGNGLVTVVEVNLTFEGDEVTA